MFNIASIQGTLHLSMSVFIKQTFTFKSWECCPSSYPSIDRPLNLTFWNISQLQMYKRKSSCQFDLFYLFEVLPLFWLSPAVMTSFFRTSIMNFSMKVLEHDFVWVQCKWNCPPMVWNAPSWPLKGDNWKIQDDASVKVGTLCKKVSRRKD